MATIHPTPHGADAESPPDTDSPFHAGEQAMQRHAGMRERTEKIGRKVIRDFMPEQHRELFATLPMLILGALDERQRPRASVLTGRPGFINSPDARTLEVAAPASQGHGWREVLAPGEPVGLLGIELETRRRNRMNGRVIQAGSAGFTVRVEQSFGNCPKYIQARRHQFIRDPAAVVTQPPVHGEGPLLSAKAARMIAGADTFFIASAFAGPGGGQVDVSHRGGKPGFVRVTSENGRTLLTAPDFLGNFHFATLGNLLLNPRAGLLFIDFTSGDVLSLSGEARIIEEGPEVHAFAGAQRLLQIRVEGGSRIEDAIPLRWSAPVEEPHVLATGTWVRP